MKIAYRCKIEKQDDKSFLVKFPSFDEIHTEGQTYEEALFNAEEALNLTLEGWMEDRLSIPIPESIVNEKEILVSPSPRIQSALLVHFNRGNHTLAALARTLETSWPSAQKLENPHHWSSLKQLSKTATALGQKLILSFQPMA